MSAEEPKHETAYAQQTIAPDGTAETRFVRTWQLPVVPETAAAQWVTRLVPLPPTQTADPKALFSVPVEVCPGTVQIAPALLRAGHDLVCATAGEGAERRVTATDRVTQVFPVNVGKHGGAKILIKCRSGAERHFGFRPPPVLVLDPSV